MVPRAARQRTKFERETGCRGSEPLECGDARGGDLDADAVAGQHCDAKRGRHQLPGRLCMLGKNISCQVAGFTLIVPALYMKSTIFIVFLGTSEYSICGSLMILRMSSTE